MLPQVLGLLPMLSNGLSPDIYNNYHTLRHKSPCQPFVRALFILSVTGCGGFVKFISHSRSPLLNTNQNPLYLMTSTMSIFRRCQGMLLNLVDRRLSRPHPVGQVLKMAPSRAWLEKTPFLSPDNESGDWTLNDVKPYGASVLLLV